MQQKASILSEPAIDAGCCTLADLFAFDENYTVSIPVYQRPYVWSTEQVNQLLKDLNGFFKSDGHKHYYLGSLLLYQENDDLAIIDGQQRITTLLMLDYILNLEKSCLCTKNNNLHLRFNNRVSRRHIAINQQYIRENKHEYDQVPTDFLGHLVFSVIMTNSRDNAFIFFVTQNNRCIPLAATDLLKSFHLRALEGQVELQRYFAKGWDAEQTKTNVTWFFNKLLWRGRNWRGRRPQFETRTLLLKEFQDNTIRAPLGYIPMYASSMNQRAFALTFSPQQQAHLQLAPLGLGQQVVDYPFSFRQPIAAGAGFFLYTEHFIALHHLLFDREQQSSLSDQPEVIRVKNFYEKVYVKCGLNNNLQDLFKLAILLFYDQFGQNELFAFAIWLDYYIGAYRIGQRNILAQTALNMVKDPERNLFDVIAGAYLPEEVFDFLRTACPSENYKIDYKRIGVRVAYFNALNDYYDKSLTLTNKKQLINEKLQSAKS